MKKILSKYEAEVNPIIKELNAIEVQIGKDFERHVALSARMIGLFTELQRIVQQKLELPICSTGSVVATEAEETARRNRFRNLGDGVIPPTPVEAKTKTEPLGEERIVDEYGYWIPKNLPPCITYSPATKRYTWSRNAATFSFSLPKGYRLSEVGEEYRRGCSFVSDENEIWNVYTDPGPAKKVTQSTYPMRKIIDE